MQTVFYRSQLDLPDALPDRTRATVTDSLASATRVLPDGPFADLLADAQHAFTVAMQYTSLTAAVLVAAAGVLAWRLIPHDGIRTRAPARSSSE